MIRHSARNVERGSKILVEDTVSYSDCNVWRLRLILGSVSHPHCSKCEPEILYLGFLLSVKGTFLPLSEKQRARTSKEDCKSRDEV